MITCACSLPGSANRVAGNVSGQLDGFDQLVILPWLGDIAEYLTLVDRIDHGGQIGIPGQQNPRGVARQLLGFLKKLHAGHFRHALIGQDDVDAVASENIQRFRTTVGEMGVEMRS